MKKIALIMATMALAFGVTGCQNWTGKSDNKCGKSNKCCRANKQQANCGKNSTPSKGGGCKGPSCSHN
jgi:hypothetical protein